MDSKYIEQLLERYWQCETSLEEEAQLRTFFMEGDVPGHLLVTKICLCISNFSRKCIWARVSMPGCLPKMEAPVVKARRLTPGRTLHAAVQSRRSSGGGSLSLGNAMQHSFFSDVEEVAAADTIGKQISAPSVALSGDRAATHEKQIYG